MSWTTLTTKGKDPGPRDSHSVALWGDKMLVFGGTNGSKKLNDLHVLDLMSNEWTQPLCTGNPPCPRESHTSTLVGRDKLVIFGGSGEGIGNYLNDLHVLDLKSMAWSSTNDHLKGDAHAPSPRDSHAAAVVGDELFVFGGDSGDRYHGETHRFDTKSMTWMKLAVEGSSPGARACHAVASIGHKVYVIGGVGDKKYYDERSWSSSCLHHDTRCSCSIPFMIPGVSSRLDVVDLVLIMSVNPGFGGQSFIESQEKKISELRRMCAKKGVNPWIEVDGEVTPANAYKVIEAGANALVAG